MHLMCYCSQEVVRCNYSSAKLSLLLIQHLNQVPVDHFLLLYNAYLQGNYNLYQRRHTLMVPNPSQMQMLRSGLSTGGQASALITPSTSTAELDESGEEVTQCLSFDMKLSIGNESCLIAYSRGVTNAQ